MCCIELLDRRQVDFSGLVAGATKTVVVVKAAAVPVFRTAVFQVRVHAVNIGTGFIDVALASTMPSCDEPGLDFVSTAPLASFTVTYGMPIGTVFEVRLPSHLGRAVRLAIVPRQGASAPLDLGATVSAQLVLKA